MFEETRDQTKNINLFLSSVCASFEPFLVTLNVNYENVLSVNNMYEHSWNTIKYDVAKL